jgi:hypothetical protein
MFGDFADRIYLIELEIKDPTDTDKSASYLDLHLEIDSKGRLRSEWLLHSAKSAIFQQYHDENKLIFNEMMMRFALY